MFHPFRTLLILSLLLAPVQSAFAQEPNRVSSTNITCSDLDGAYVLSQQSPPVYLGFLGNQVASHSIMNSFGTYGSQFSSLSVRNTFGQYGSSFGTFSANNQFTSTPPGIFKNGLLIAYLTTNTIIIGGVSLATIDASCTFSSSSPVVNTPPPAAPTAVSASDGLYTDAIEVTWAPVAGATIYGLFRAESLAGPPLFVTETPNTVLPVFDGVPGKVYWFWVAAANSSGLSNLSDPDSGFIAPASSSFSLSVQKSGDGSGRVSGSPPGIDCGATCTAQFTAGTVVTLTATSDIGSTFVGWSGVCTGAAACIVTMDSDRAVTAEFKKEDEPPVDESSTIHIPMVIR